MTPRVLPPSSFAPPQVALFWGKARRVVATKVALQVGPGPARHLEGRGYDKKPH